MRVQSLALLAGATAAVAADTVTLFLPGFDSQDLVGKVVGSSGSTTTYVINCPGSTDSDDCGVPPSGITVAQAHSSVAIAYGAESVTISEKCEYDATSVSCSVSMNESGLTTAFQTGVPRTEIPGALMPVTITGTGAAGASATTGASASASTAASTGASTLTTSASASDNTAASTATGTSTGDSSDSSSAAATSSTETGNAAMPMITGRAGWAAAGGVAAALAFAAL
ncbi:hypothetical protein MYU51_018145 [Penicillium brevicompactum]|uniref:uncharacterized protein n=1 Tax=Penicillium brevicompactum TaxID=5074 RepID=UPI00254212C7|nr:uncharacterized protein N7506_010577 [Penicillium brevicompactum]KAJ5327475.1 hypothetical protein N7506_010577 [Penicillium brevicompactum]